MAAARRRPTPPLRAASPRKPRYALSSRRRGAPHPGESRLPTLAPARTARIPPRRAPQHARAPATRARLPGGCPWSCTAFRPGSSRRPAAASRSPAPYGVAGRAAADGEVRHVAAVQRHVAQVTVKTCESLRRRGPLHCSSLERRLLNTAVLDQVDRRRSKHSRTRQGGVRICSRRRHNKRPRLMRT